jgi:hypothetical protein
VNAQIKAEVAALVRSRYADLRRRSFEELTSLPEVETENHEIARRAVPLTTYRVSRSESEILVVVQAIRNGFLGFHLIEVEGFVARSNAETVDAPDEMLWDYS